MAGLRFCSVALALSLCAISCQAGWLKPGGGGSGFVVQTYTGMQPVTGNNTGTIYTNGNSYQIAGDNSGVLSVGSPGAQFRGVNAGTALVDAAGSFILGSYAALSSVTNVGVGSLMLGKLTVGQKALITDVGSASILLGAGVVSNTQSIVVGDGQVSHGTASVTAESFWGGGAGLRGIGSNQVSAGGLSTQNLNAAANAAYRNVAETQTFANVLVLSPDAAGGWITNLRILDMTTNPATPSTIRGVREIRLGDINDDVGGLSAGLYGLSMDGPQGGQIFIYKDNGHMYFAAGATFPTDDSIDFWVGSTHAGSIKGSGAWDLGGNPLTNALIDAGQLTGGIGRSQMSAAADAIYSLTGLTELVTTNQMSAAADAAYRNQSYAAFSNAVQAIIDAQP